MSLHANNPFAVCNDAPSLSDLKMIQQYRMLHRERVKNSRAVIHTANTTTEHSHLKVNRKKQQLVYEQNARIQRANLLLVDKLRSILRPKAQDPTSALAQLSASNPNNVPTAASVVSREALARSLPGRTLHSHAREKRSDAIMAENHKMLTRIINAQPTYTREMWQQSAEEKRRRAQNACRFPYQDPQITKASPSAAAMVEFGLLPQLPPISIRQYGPVHPNATTSIAAVGTADMGGGGGSGSGSARDLSASASQASLGGASASQKRRLQNLTSTSSRPLESSRAYYSDYSPSSSPRRTVLSKTSDTKVWRVLANADPVAAYPRTREPVRATALDEPQSIIDALRNRSPDRGGSSNGTSSSSTSSSVTGGPTMAQLRSMFGSRPPPRNTLFEGNANVSGRLVRIIVNEFVDPWSIEIKAMDLKSQRVFTIRLPMSQLKLVYGPNSMLFEAAYRRELTGLLISSCRFVPRLSPQEQMEKDAYDYEESARRGGGASPHRHHQHQHHHHHHHHHHHQHQHQHGDGDNGNDMNHRDHERSPVRGEQSLHIDDLLLCLDLTPEVWQPPEHQTDATGPVNASTSTSSSALQYAGATSEQQQQQLDNQGEGASAENASSSPEQGGGPLQLPDGTFSVYKPSGNSVNTNGEQQQQQQQQRSPSRSQPRSLSRSQSRPQSRDPDDAAERETQADSSRRGSSSSTSSTGSGGTGSTNANASDSTAAGLESLVSRLMAGGVTNGPSARKSVPGKTKNSDDRGTTVSADAFGTSTPSTSSTASTAAGGGSTGAAAAVAAAAAAVASKQNKHRRNNSAQFGDRVGDKGSFSKSGANNAANNSIGPGASAGAGAGGVGKAGQKQRASASSSSTSASGGADSSDIDQYLLASSMSSSTGGSSLLPGESIHVLEVTVGCRNLPIAEISRKCDPIVHVYGRNLSGAWYALGEATEVKIRARDVDFSTPLKLRYNPAGITEFAFSVLDALSSEGVGPQSEVLGTAAIEVSNLLAAPGKAIVCNLRTASGEELANDGNALLLITAVSLSVYEG